MHQETDKNDHFSVEQSINLLRAEREGTIFFEVFSSNVDAWKLTWTRI